MDILLRIFLLFFLAFRITEASTGLLGVRLVLNRAADDVSACIAEEHATVDDILHLAVRQSGRLRAPTSSQSCTKLCREYEPGSCFVSASCQEDRNSTSLATVHDNLASRGELDTLCRESKWNVISTLRREIAKSDLSGQCRASVGGNVELACYLLDR